MTDDRASLGARIAEAMGCQHKIATMEAIDGRPEERTLYLVIGEWRLPEDIIDWDFYGEVDAWMREQGWMKSVETYGREVPIYVMWESLLGPWEGNGEAAYEPEAVIKAALAALDHQAARPLVEETLEARE